LPDAIEAVYVKEKIVEGVDEYQDSLINDLASGLYGTFFSVGQILAPTLGGALYDSIGFRHTADFMAVACLGYSIVFFVFNVGFSIFSSERKIRLKMQVLK